MNTIVMFQSDYAIKYGLEEAIVLELYLYIFSCPQSDERLYVDGKYWVRRNALGHTIFLPFWSNRKVMSILASLEKQGVVYPRRIMEKTGDQTVFYTLNDDLHEKVFASKGR